MNFKLLNSNFEVLKRAAPAKMGKRFVACVVDMLLVVFVAAVIFSGIFAITKSTDSYKKAAATVEEEISIYEELTASSGVVEYIDGERVSEDALAFQNLIKAIYKSYTIKGNKNFNFDKIYEKFEKQKIDMILAKPDNIEYFYAEYLSDPAKILTTYKTLDAFGDSFTLLFEEYESMPILNENAAYCIFYYLCENETDSIGETGSSYYQTFINKYTNMLLDAEDMVRESEPYYSTHYLAYSKAYCNQARYTNISLLISIFIASAICLLVPKYLFKNEKTVGYKLLGLGVINMENEENKWYIPLIKFIFELVGFIPTALILYLLPPFNGVFDAMFLPVTLTSEVSLGLIILIATILGAVLNAFGLFTHYRQSLINLIFKDKVVDIHYIDLGDRDEKHEGRPY